MNETNAPKKPTGSSSDSEYLARLSFDPKLRDGFLNFFVTHTRVILLMMLMLMGWGAYAYNVLPRESNPEIKIPNVIVNTFYPGASPSDIEELVTKKIEKEVSAVKGVEKVTSTSSNSTSSIVVQFAASEDISDATRRVRDAVSTVKNDFPEEVTEPIVAEISFDDQPIMTMAITGPYDGFTLRAAAEKLQEEIEKVPGVREVNLSGGDKKEFSIAYDPAKLTTYGISPDTANQAVRLANQAIPGGNFDGQMFTYPIRSDGRFFDVETLGSIPVVSTASGAVVELADIAHIEERAIKRTILSRLSIGGTTPENAITLGIVKKTGGSIIDITSEARRITAELLPTFPGDMRTDVITDYSEQIAKDFNQLGHDFLLTIALVMITLILVVGFKEAIIAGLTIPLVFFATFGVMELTGTSLNFLSLFSLLLSMGLLVDDAIVVVSATKQYLRSGKFTPEEAVLLVLRDFKVVLLTTTLATTFAFLPLLLSTGIIGQFIKSIPITVSVTLISSLIIAVLINHPLAAALERIRFTRSVYWALFISALGLGTLSVLYLGGVAGFAGGALGFGVAILLAWYRYQRGGERAMVASELLMERELHSDELIKQKLIAQNSGESGFVNKLMHGVVHIDHIIPLYEKIVRYLISTRKRRVLTIVATLVLFVASVMLPVTGVVKSIFFPASDENTIFINIKGATGLRLEETDKAAMQVEAKLLAYPEIKNFSTIVGQGAGQGGGSSSYVAGITVALVDTKVRDIKSYDLATKIRTDVADIDGVEVTVDSESGGPPAGAAFEAQIRGADLRELSTIADELKKILATVPGVTSIDSSLDEAPAEYTFTFDQARLKLYGLDATSVGSTIRMAVSGTEVSTVLRDNDEIKVVARFDERALTTLQQLQDTVVLNRGGTPVYLRDVATVELKPSVSSISRIDEKRVVSVSAGVVGETSSTEVLAAFQAKMKEVGYQLPDGYTLTYGGENEENAKSVQSILQAMIIAAILIVATLVIQFNSFRKALLVLVTLPLALIGVFIGLAVFQVPLSFAGLIGILALFGIVVKNAIILVDKINANIGVGIPFVDAVVDAGKSRLEAILITSLCTILGLLPITISNDFWQALGSAIIFGLIFSSFLTLFIIPVLYIVLSSKREREPYVPQD